MAEAGPFHLSFPVPDLSAARSFYVDKLDCTVGRETNTWIDIVFFGHQLTLHQASGAMHAQKLDHFGPVLRKATWTAVAKSLRDRGVNFVMPPKITAEGTPQEAGKYLIADPAGNVLEFKYYRDFRATLQGNS